MVTNTVFSKYNDTVYIRAKERTALEHKKSLAFLPVGEKARVLSVENGGNMKKHFSAVIEKTASGSRSYKGHRNRLCSRQHIRRHKSLHDTRCIHCDTKVRRRADTS